MLKCNCMMLNPFLLVPLINSQMWAGAEKSTLMSGNLSPGAIKELAPSLPCSSLREEGERAERGGEKRRGHLGAGPCCLLRANHSNVRGPICSVCLAIKSSSKIGQPIKLGNCHL